jgi:hypothetical protein
MWNVLEKLTIVTPKELIDLHYSYRYEDSCEAVRACTVYRCTWYRYR